MKYFKLNDGNKIPVLGFGTWQLTRDICRESVLKALEGGYRHIDTADVYGNHKEIAKAIKQSNINRSELFITSKVWRSELKKDLVLYAGERFLEELDTDYLDLLLIHWPNSSVPIQETLTAFQELKTKGLIKSYGVSNFTKTHLEEIKNLGLEITVNQVEFHPSLNQKELKKYCDKNNIVITAFSPIAQGQDLKLPLILELSKKYKKSTSQVILNWLISKNIVAIPRSSNINHIKDNFGTLKWHLNPDDIKKIDNIGSNNRLNNPSFAEFN